MIELSALAVVAASFYLGDNRVLAESDGSLEARTTYSSPNAAANDSKDAGDESLSSDDVKRIELLLDTREKLATPFSERLWTTIGDFEASAYCLRGRTASGEMTRPGVVAADPRVLPIGTVVHIQAGEYSGIYKVLDTGGKVKGRRVDIYCPTYAQAVRFGRRTVKVKVISPRNSSPGASQKTPSGARQK